ncbi:MAG: universal stress protein [Rickettsia sp.]|nr:universal stress protein [Rickettsia sp.]
MFKKIIVPIDVQQDTRSLAILEKAINFAKPFSSEIHIVHIVPCLLNRVLDEYLPQNWNKKRLLKVKDKLSAITPKNIPNGLKFTTHVSKGNVHDEILQYAYKEDGDLIMLFAIDTLTKNYILGYNTREILKNSTISVIIVRE